MKRTLGVGGWALGVALALTVSACAHSAPADDIVRVAIQAAPISFDPRTATDEQSQRVHQLVYDHLGALAARLDNPDPLTCIVHLRHGVKFHDGHELSAKDVVYTFGSVLDPTMKSVTALDDHTVRLTLKDATGSFPAQLARHVVPDGGGDGLRTFPIGTGPYRFLRYVVGKQVEFVVFEGYWDGLPQNAGVTLRIIPDEAMRVRELRQGSADIIINDANVAVTRPGVENVRLTPTAGFWTLKDVKKVAPYGPDRLGPSDAGGG